MIWVPYDLGNLHMGAFYFITYAGGLKLHMEISLLIDFFLTS